MTGFWGPKNKERVYSYAQKVQPDGHQGHCKLANFITPEDSKLFGKFAAMRSCKTL